MGLPAEVGGGRGTSPEGRGDIETLPVGGGLDEAGPEVWAAAVWLSYGQQIGN